VRVRGRGGSSEIILAFPVENEEAMDEYDGIEAVDY
jgi:hypothetical protein